MLDVFLPVAVLAMLLAFVAQIRRLISHAILNGTIRKAMETDPASAPLLIAKLEPRPRWPDGLAGWVAVLAGLALGIAALFEEAPDQRQMFEIAAMALIAGTGVLLYAWWVERATPTA